jgi:hypothetical protein
LNSFLTKSPIDLPGKTSQSCVVIKGRSGD